MKIKLSPCWLVSLILVALIFSGPMKLIAVADSSGSFFAGYSYLLKEDKLPTATSTAIDLLIDPSNTKIETSFSFSKFLGTTSPAVGKIIRVRVRVKPIGQAINLANAVINYSTSTLRLLEVDSNVSDFSMNFVSGQAASGVFITVMQPWPGIATSSIAADLVFLATAAGQAEIDFTPESTAFANDGFGTEVFTTVEPTDFIII